MNPDFDVNADHKDQAYTYLLFSFTVPTNQLRILSGAQFCIMPITTP
jgi:hypothetical protein